MNNLILAPSVYIIGATQANRAGIREFLEDHHEEEVNTKGTPAARIMYDLIEGDTGRSDIDLLCEFNGRFCYRSFGKGRGHEEYIDNILESAHGSVTEHTSIEFGLTGISRSLSLELIRHRAGTAVSQESQRFVPAEDVKLVVPPLFINENGFVDPTIISFYNDQLDTVREQYEFLINYAKDRYKDYPAHERNKRIREAARSVLPNDAETRMVFTTNIRALRHILELRGAVPADLEIRRLAVAMLNKVREDYGSTFYNDYPENLRVLEDLTVGEDRDHGTIVSRHRKV